MWLSEEAFTLMGLIREIELFLSFLESKNENYAFFFVMFKNTEMKPNSDSISNVTQWCQMAYNCIFLI